MDGLVERHLRACAGFARVAHAVPPDSWSVPTPCTEWNARAVVEHVIGFHDFLLLRPLGVRASRPREDAAARWDATSDALVGVLAPDGALDRETELPGGGTSTPRTMIGALTTDVLIHTWDLARATGISPALDDELCARAYDSARTSEIGRASGIIGPEIAVAADAPLVDKLVALYGRDPTWSP